MGNEEIKVTSLWDSKAERIVYDILKEKINMEAYQISKHVPLKDILKNKEKESWTEWHIDLLIEDIKGYPVLGIEINGILHWNDPQIRKRDKEEKILFAKAGIPLIFIPLPELPSYTKEEYRTEYAKALRELLDKYLLPFYYKTSYPVYCRMCG